MFFPVLQYRPYIVKYRATLSLLDLLAPNRPGKTTRLSDLYSQMAADNR